MQLFYILLALPLVLLYLSSLFLCSPFLLHVSPLVFFFHSSVDSWRDGQTVVGQIVHVLLSRRCASPSFHFVPISTYRQLLVIGADLDFK